MFPHIRAAVLHYDRVTPHGTAVRCTSHLTVHGAGFSSLLLYRSPASFAAAPSSPDIQCAFRGMSPDGNTHAVGFVSRATVVDDATLQCESPNLARTGVYPMRIDVCIGGSHTAHAPALKPPACA